jgi:L-cysteine:1D-myo-inositol 2-amino-2-deoxy-alpha-D-glucopyranoside ligase
MRLFDTRAGMPVELVAGRTVRLYVCGITPYDAAHLGHAFTYVAFDVLARYLEHLGHRVRHVRNVTDVDDDILRTARDLQVDYRELAVTETAKFDRELAGLACRRPDAVPWATEVIPAIQTTVRGLLRRGNAYALDDGRVYFEVATAPRFGELSRLDRDEMLRQFGEKGGDPDAAGKRDPRDFLLWQPSAAGEPAWDSPWGPGRPGWHIECSVMAMEELGSTIDIHGGGADLVFPHHEAEIVQSEHLTGQAPFARWWAHTGMVGLDGTKMSKSLGNLVFTNDLLERYEPGAVRRYLLEHHYRADWDYDADELLAAGEGYKHWVEAAGRNGTDADAAEAFHAAMDDDLDTPRAIAAVDTAAARGAGATVRALLDLLGFPPER